MSGTKKETDVTGHRERRSTDSPLSQLTKESLRVRHTLHASQTEFSLFLWTLSVYECVGASGPIWGLSRPTRSLWATRRILSRLFPWIRSLQTGGQIWAHMVPNESANKRQTGAMTQCDPLWGATESCWAPLLLLSGPMDLSVSCGQLPAICLHLALHPCNKDPPWQPA